MPRTSYPPPQHTDNAETAVYPPRSICFLHPGYGVGHQTFLILPAADIGGTCHHETARLSCAIIAGNRVDGFLSEDQDGQQRVTGGTEFPLEKNEYYFQVPSGNGLDLEYPVIPTFLHWSPPPLPEYWERCTVPPNPPHPMPRVIGMQVANRDISCRMTQCKESTENAHIIPNSVGDWFRTNEMYRFADFEHHSNAILFRSDIHTIWDSKKCTIIPKDSTGVSVLVMYVLRRDCPEEIIRLYHDVELQPLYGIDLNFLFARFALTVFDQTSVRNFLERGVKRHLRMRATDGTIQDRWCSAEECRTQAPRARSASPTKRPRAGPGTTKSDVKRAVTGFGSCRSSSSTDTEGSEAAAEQIWDGVSWDDNGRGRKRRRRSSSSCSFNHHIDFCLRTAEKARTNTCRDMDGMNDNDPGPQVI